MQVSAVNAILNNPSVETASGVNIKGFDVFQEAAFDIYNPSEKNQPDDDELYCNVRLWKHFCQKQIAAGYLDIVV